jgi:hypothetical protein
MDDVQALLNRPKFYYNIDGVGELAVGVMGMGYLLLFWLQVHSPLHSFWNKLYPLVIYVALMSLGLHYGTKAVKQRITYPRTGFVSYKKSMAFWPAVFSITVASVTAFGFLTLLRHGVDSTTPACLIGGLFFAVCYGYGMARAVSWKWLVAWGIVLAAVVVAFLPGRILVSLTGDSWTARYFDAKLVGAFLLYWMALSMLLLISGGISFFLYLRHTQAPAQDGE